MPRPVALAFAVLAFSAGASAAAPPSPTQIFRDHCIPFLQGARTQAAAGTLAEKAGFPLADTSTIRRSYRTPLGRLDFVQMMDGQRHCAVWLPRDAWYPDVLVEVTAWVPTLPDGPWKLYREPGPNVEGERMTAWDGPRWSLEINEEFADDDSEIHLFIEGSTPRKK